MNVLKPLWIVNLLFGIAGFLMFIAGGGTVPLLVAVAESLVLSITFDNTWRK